MTYRPNNEEYRPNQAYNFIEDADYGTFNTPIIIQLDPKTELPKVNANADVEKFLQDGQLIIRKNGKNYNAIGVEL